MTSCSARLLSLSQQPILHHINQSRSEVRLREEDYINLCHYENRSVTGGFVAAVQFEISCGESETVDTKRYYFGITVTGNTKMLFLPIYQLVGNCELQRTGAGCIHTLSWWQRMRAGAPSPRLRFQGCCTTPPPSGLCSTVQYHAKPCICFEMGMVMLSFPVL